MERRTGLSVWSVESFIAKERIMVERKSNGWKSELPKKCDVCHEPLRGSFVDGATVFGPWGILCRGCHLTHGRGLGTGRGQRYDLATGAKLEG